MERKFRVLLCVFTFVALQAFLIMQPRSSSANLIVGENYFNDSIFLGDEALVFNSADNLLASIDDVLIRVSRVPPPPPPPGTDTYTAYLDSWVLIGEGEDVDVNGLDIDLTFFTDPFPPIIPLIMAKTMGGTPTFVDDEGPVGGWSFFTAPLEITIDGSPATITAGYAKPVPEPATIFLLASGLIGAGALRKRFKARH